ncbi:MAG: helix-turn-helix domain-containing protein [Streptococcaceae bacterium]|jgi:transcriptional regulator with XRE-family HTH domain|nr:helix-turn-helix domain-containing protein [Streptococcaceae bacterium]
MGIYDRIKELAANKRVSIRKVEEDLGYSNGTIRRWNKFPPTINKVLNIADYFHTTDAYLLGRVDDPEQFDWDSTIRISSPTEEDRKEYADFNRMFEGVEAYNGQPMTEHDRKVIEAMVKSYMENKEK